MTTPSDRPVTVLGLGEMGRALADVVLAAGHPTTVWNRTPGRDAGLLSRGAAGAPSVHDAVTAGPLIVTCLYDATSVRDTLDPVAADLRGRTLVNLTTSTPNEARALADWAAAHDVDYLDGAIMAIPPMMGTPTASILYSGSRSAYDRHRPVLDHWATSTYDGPDAGAASLFDLAMLSGMYVMFAGFMHGAAMVGRDGVTAKEFAARATPFLAAMTETFGVMADTIDSGDYGGGQSLSWTAQVLEAITTTSTDQHVDPAPITMVRHLVHRQIDAGHGSDDVDRMFESLRGTPSQS